MKIKLSKLHCNAVSPTYATDGSGAFDLVAVSRDVTRDGVVYGTGLAFEIPKGNAMFIYSRSGHGFNGAMRLANCVGVIDSDYRGEVKVKMTYDGDDRASWPRVGDRIAQGVIVKTPRCEFVDAILSDTDRGENGFGSSGK